jgi:uncharacterized protein YyaL (SSP411 family)
MRLPNFTVVSFVVVTLAGFAAITGILYPLIPPTATNRLAKSDEPFVRMGDRQLMDWIPYGRSVFTSARQTGRPILLVIGTPWSRTGRMMDKEVFSDPEVVNFARRNFVCARIDADAHPEWLNALLPITRLRIGFEVDWQMWFLDSRGRLLDFYGRKSADMPDQLSTIQALIAAKRRFEDIVGSSNVQPSEPQKSDYEELRRMPKNPQFPDPASSIKEIKRRIGTQHGGFPNHRMQRWYPNAWRLLASLGELHEIRQSLDPLLRTPMVDLLDGGFFHGSASLDGRAVEYDKVAVENAEMVALLAGLRGNPLYRQLGNAGFDWLAGFRTEIPACRVGDELRDGRSERSSFWPSRLRSILPGDERNWAQDHLGLRPADNPRMTPYLATDDSMLDVEDRTRILNLLRSPELPVERLITRRRVTTDALVIARLIEAARRRNDPRRLARALEVGDRLNGYIEDDQILDEPFSSNKLAGFQGCLCVADAALQYYLATGRPTAWDMVTIALTQAAAFERAPGIFTLFRPSNEILGVQNTEVPEVLDNHREAASAQAVRLFMAYKQLIGVARARPWHQRAYDIASHFTSLLDGGGPAVGGLLAAAIDVRDDCFVACVGKQARFQAANLAARLPWRLVVAARGEVCPELQSLPDGIYLVRQGISQGPYSPDAAVTEASQRNVSATNPDPDRHGVSLSP